MHPLAYRICTNKLPDCSVDAMQWSILNIKREKNLAKKGQWSNNNNKCQGLEIFNDFTYTNSYNSELQLTPVDNPDFVIPCLNGQTMHFDQHDEVPLSSKPPKYTWWFNPYPLEFAEFLLVTALSNGVWLHPLAANDVGYQRSRGLAERTEDSQVDPKFYCQALKGDPKSSMVEPPHRGWKGPFN